MEKIIGIEKHAGKVRKYNFLTNFLSRTLPKKINFFFAIENMKKSPPKLGHSAEFPSYQTFSLTALSCPNSPNCKVYNSRAKIWLLEQLYIELWQCETLLNFIISLKPGEFLYPKMIQHTRIHVLTYLYSTP